jgi:hypothetical protein
MSSICGNVSFGRFGGVPGRGHPTRSPQELYAGGSWSVRRVGVVTAAVRHRSDGPISSISTSRRDGAAEQGLLGDN